MLLHTHGRYCIFGMERSPTEGIIKNTFFRSARFSLWLSWKELNGRKVIFSINVILIALFIALPVTLDLMGKARKGSVETRIDYIGPSLILVPKGIISSDLVTAQLKGKTFSSSKFNTIQGKFSSHLRNADTRLTTRFLINGRNMPVVGIDFGNVYSYPFVQYSMSSKEVLLGTVAKKKLQKKKGDILRIQSQDFRIAGIIPTTGGIDDASVFLPLTVLQKLAKQEGRINEIRLFPASVSSYEKLKERLKEFSDELNIIDAYRGDTAEKDVNTTLQSYQKALYTVAFILIALCIMISTYINLDGRKAEVSTVYTVGATQGIIFQILTFRTIWITVLGSYIGQCIALLITSLQDRQIPLRLILSFGTFFEVILGTVCLGMLVTTPFALYSVYKRDPTSYL
ncbi:ABC transporter permease [bacterium]|nr:MAG: ABC transporter permease [bacterium]